MPRSFPLPSRATRLALAFAVAASGACGGAESATPPRAEFIVAAGDTSLWVRTGPGAGARGIEVRRAPILLTRLDGGFHEIYVTEDDYSFPNAHFAAQTVWRRDLRTGDSVVVYGDATVPRLAIAYGRRHPYEAPLAGDEELAEDPAVVGITEAYVVDVHGPLATIESYADMHPGDGDATHRERRRIVDLRRGAELTLADLLGERAGARVAARGRLAAARSSHPFDERSFTIASLHGAPGVAFYVPERGDDEESRAISLPPIPVPPGAWWSEARRALPVEGTGRDADVARWPRHGLVVEARRGDGGDRLALRDAAGAEWPLGRVTDGARRVYWLDDGTSAADRAALARAFYDATLYDGTLRAASRDGAHATPHLTPVTRHP